MPGSRIRVLATPLVRRARATGGSAIFAHPILDGERESTELAAHPASLHGPILQPRDRRRRRAGRALPVARLGASGRARLPDRGAGRGQFPRTGAARGNQPSRDLGNVRPHRPLPQARAARHRRAAVPLLGPPRQQADRRVRSPPPQGRHAFSLCAAVRAHQDRGGSARAREGASRHRAAAVDDVYGIHPKRRRRGGAGDRSGRRIRNHSRRLSRQRRRRTQHRAQGARHRVRGLHLSRPHLEYRSRLRLQAARLYRAQLHLRSRRMVEPVPLEGSARPLARAFSDRARR